MKLFLKDYYFLMLILMNFIDSFEIHRVFVICLTSFKMTHEYLFS